MDPSSNLSEIQQLNEQIKKLVRAQSYSNAFFKGLFSGLGSVIGATILVAMLVWFLSQLPLIPIIGSFMADIVTNAQEQLLLGR